MTIYYVVLSLVTLFAITSATGNGNVTNVEGDLSRSEHAEMDSGATINVKEVTESRRRMAESTFISEHGKCLRININFIYPAQNILKWKAIYFIFRAVNFTLLL